MARTLRKSKGRRESGRFYTVPHTVVESAAFRSLSPLAQKLWHDLMLQYNGRNNGRIAAVLSQLEQRGWSNGSLHRNLKALQAHGFIAKTRQGGIGAMRKTCSLYRFSHLATDPDPELGLTLSPPTNEFRAWKPAEK